MGNLRAAALACGVVASCFAGGIGISYISSDKVSSAKIVAEDVAGDISKDHIDANHRECYKDNFNDNECCFKFGSKNGR